MAQKIIVTGGLGFIGSHTVVELILAGFEPVIVDDLSNSEKFILERIDTIVNKKVSFHKVNCCDKNAFSEVIKKEGGINGIIHFAAYKSVGESVSEPLKYYNNNINSLLVMLECITEFNIPNIVFSSSCTVYGQPEILPVTEETPFGEIKAPYGNTKRICEEIIRDYAATGASIKALSLRYFNPIGAHSSGLIGELPKGIPNNLMPFITQTAKGIRKQLSVFGSDYNTIDGTCVRDFIHVVDLAKAHVRSIQYLNEQFGHKFYDFFNVGTGKGTSVLEMIKAFEKANNLKLNYQIVDRREGDIEKIYADTSKVNTILGWKSTLNIEQASRDAWNWEQKL
jgi:UDP-glucose 4-epimerase